MILFLYPLFYRSSVSVMPVTMHFQLRPDSPTMTPALEAVPEESVVQSSSPGKGMLTNFVKSVKSRLIVMQVRYFDKFKFLWRCW